MATSRGRFLCALYASLAAAPLAHAEDRMHGSIGAVTDYLYRGVSQTDGKAAVQAGVQARLPAGWSAGVWGSTVNRNADDHTGFELDLHAARVWSLNADWSAVVGLTHREYVSDRSAVDYDHDEISASLSYQERITGSVAYSPNTALYHYGPVRGRAVTYELMVQHPLTPNWLVFAGAGRSDLRDVLDDEYSYWSAGVTYSWAALQLDLAHIGADESAEHIFGDRAHRQRWTCAFSVRF